MPVDKTRYRRIEFVGARILQARELNKFQRIDRNLDDSNSAAAYGIRAVYRQGAMMNVTIGLSGLVVTLSATDNTKPMLIFVVDRWEILKTSEAPAITYTAGQTSLYLNWVIKKITSAQDSDLIDATTLGDTAFMGELQLSVSKTDTSGVALAGDEYEKNTTPIVMATFTNNGSVLTLVSPINGGTGDKGNIKDQALADDKTGGLVYLSTGTSDGKAVADDDPRMTDTRTPANLSVTDAKVRVPVATGNTNADGTAEYTLPADGGSDPGGISAAKIILLTAKQTIEAGWNWLKAQFLALQSAYNAHANAALGLGNTHPVPTAQQVGATPLSHVGQPLGLPTSHPATASMSTGGFRLVRDAAVTRAADDFAYGVQEGGNILGGIDHQGNVYSLLGDSSTIPGSDGDGALTNNGVLGHYAKLAAVLAEHVGKVSHKNPHGLAAGDIGAATVNYVDTQDQNILSSALAFAELMGSIAVRKVTSIAPTVENVWSIAGQGNTPSGNQSASTLTRFFGWVIFTFGGRFELAIGLGTLRGSDAIPLPPSDSNGSWPVANQLASAAMSSYIDKNDLNDPTWQSAVASVSQTGDGAGAYRPSGLSARDNSQWATFSIYAQVNAIAWRFITAPPVLISMSPTTGTTGASITITGRNFGSVIGNATVHFGGVVATVTSCNPTSIVATVPAGAATGPITVDITVSARAGINTLTFTKT